MRDLQTAGVLDSIASAGDFLAGDVDETVGRLASDIEEGELDPLEVPARTLDDLAGSTDEAVARQFDDQPGGGILDGVISTSPLFEGTEDFGINTGTAGAGEGSPPYVQQSSASVENTDVEVPPGGPGTQVIRVRNGVANVAQDNPNRRPTSAQDVVSPEGAVIGIGAAAAGAAAAGASLGSVAGPAGVAIGGAAGAAGSLVASYVEEFVGALGYTITAAIDDTVVGQTVTSVGVPAGGVGTNGKSVQLQHSVPQEPGEYTMNVVVSMWQTGEVVEEIEIPITVVEGADPNTVNNGGSGSGSGNGNGGGSGRPIIDFAIENPGLAAIAGVGSLVAINSFAGGAGEGITQ